MLLLAIFGGESSVASDQPSPFFFSRDLRQSVSKYHAASLRGADLQALLDELDKLDVLDEDEEGNNESTEHQALDDSLALGDSMAYQFVDEKNKKPIPEPSVLSFLWDGADQVLRELDLRREAENDVVEDGHIDKIEGNGAFENLDSEDGYKEYRTKL